MEVIHKSPAENSETTLWVQLCIPVKEIHPAFVQIVRREAAAVVVQILDRRPERHVHGPHVELFAGLVGFAQVARGAGSDHVFPGCQAPFGARDQVIEGEFLFAAAILALELVAKEYVEAGKGGVPAGFDEGF